MRLTQDDPFQLGRQLLDNTPWWVEDNRSGTERSLGFCNPYGYEDDNPVVLGGLRNPDREAYTWQCTNYAQGRYRMSCNGSRHTGMVMRLCYAHVYMIQKRQGGLCPACAMPPRARELDEKANRIMRDLADPRMQRDWPRMYSELESVRAEMDELRARGIITSGAPLTLTEIS